MKDVLVYLFWPNPGNATYDSPKALAALVLCALLIVGSFAFSAWRKKQSNQSMRKLSKSWSSAMFWFGLIGLILVVARVESIQFIAMRVWWVVWAAVAIAFAVFQAKRYRRQYYEVIPTKKSSDPRSRYLPKRKRS